MEIFFFEREFSIEKRLSLLYFHKRKLVFKSSKRSSSIGIWECKTNSLTLNLFKTNQLTFSYLNHDCVQTATTHDQTPCQSSVKTLSCLVVIKNND